MKRFGWRAVFAWGLMVAACAGLRADTFAYAAGVATSSSSVFGILDVNTGAFTQVSTEPVFFADLAVAPSGTVYVLTSPFQGGNGEFGTINPGTGAITNIATVTTGLSSLAFGPAGALYATTYNPNGPASLYTVDPATGNQALVATVSPAPFSTEVNDIRFVGNTIYTSTYTSPSGLYTIDPATGVATLVATTGLPQDNSITGVVNGQLVFTGSTGTGLVGPGHIYWVDPATGTTTGGASTSLTYNFALIPTPEPGTIGLSVAGLLGTLILRRRLRRA